MTFPNYAVFELNYLTKTGEKPLRIRQDNTCSGFFKDTDHEKFLKRGTEPKPATIFDRIEKGIEKIEHCKDRFAHARELFRETKIFNEFQLSI